MKYFIREMKNTLIILVLILTTGICYSINEVKKISLDEAIKFALETNPQIKTAKLNTSISKNEIKIANRLQNPSIHTFQNMGTAGEGNPQQVGADYAIEILKRGKRKTLAESDSIIAYDNEQFKIHGLILEVKKSYIDLLLKKSNLKIMKEQEKLSKELLDNITLESNKGIVPKTEVIQARIAYNRSVMASSIAKSEVVFSQNRFNTVMNTSNFDYDTKEDALNDDYKKLNTINPKNNTITFESIKNYALSNRFDLLGARQEVESAKNNLKVVKSKLIPDIEVTGGYSYQTKGISDTGYFQSGAYAGASLVNIPLVYHYQPEIKNAQLEIEKAQLKYQDMQIDILRNITDAWEKFVIARDNLNFYNKELLNDSKELLEASIQSLNKQEIDVTTFLVSKKLYLDLMLGYEEALKDYYISYAELLKEMNAKEIFLENV